MRRFSGGRRHSGRLRRATIQQRARPSSGARIVLPACGRVDYRYELRRGDEVVATGHLMREEEVGDRLEINGQPGIVRTIEPLLGEHELRLVEQLVRDRV